MSEEKTIRVYDVVGGEDCVSSEDGQRVYEQEREAFNGGLRVNLSFQNVRYIISAFLHAAIGQLYGQFDEDFIRSHLRILDMAQEHRATLKRVVEDAKAYFKDPKRAEAARRSVLEEDDGEG